MAQLSFVDTNIVVYANDGRDLNKQLKAQSLLYSLIASNTAVLSSQVVQEFCNVMLKGKQPFMRSDDLKIVLSEIILPLMRHSPDPDFYIRALNLTDQHAISLYDSLIVEAALELDCDILYSEDLQHGQQFGKLKIVNPFQ